MTQIDDRLLELINAGIDNELGEEEMGQLHERLQDDPEARELHGDLRKLGQELDSLGDLNPPAQIRENILDEIAPDARSITLRLIAALLPSSTLPRYALAFAGGLLFGTLALQLGEGYRSGMDPSQFVGTMTDYGSLPHAITADKISLELDQISGSIRLHQIGSMLVIEFNLDSADAVNVVTGYSGQPVDFKGFSLLDNELSSFVADTERVSLVARGTHRYSVFLEKQQQGETDISVMFSTEGEVFHQDTLKSPAVE